MPKRLTIQELIETFTNHLVDIEARDQRLSHISEMWHGFEGWLKFEMAAMLCRTPWNYSPWVKQDDRWIAGDVGVEHRARLKGTEPGIDSKLIDLWVSPAPKADERHFIELKVVFNNFNKGKMAASWRADFDALCRLDPREKPAGIASLLFGVGFTQEQFARLTAPTTKELPPATKELEKIVIPGSRNDSAPLLLRALVRD